MRAAKAVISSTAADLVEHRKAARDACLRQNVLPLLMETMAAASSSGLDESLRLVNSASIYIGILGFRYGFIPEGHTKSITEQEYDRAVERGIPRLLFVMHDDHSLTAAGVETGKGAERLRSFKQRARKEHVVAQFSSPTELRALLIDALSRLRAPEREHLNLETAVPRIPDPFVAHPYTLLETGQLIGRRAELSELTDWVSRPHSELLGSSVLTVVAMGGMGKSALTWKWFNEVAPLEMPALEGSIWWSFYESGATFENFIIHALAYVTGQPLGEVEKIRAADREVQLLGRLNQGRFLVVLDGLERALVAYARIDAASLPDEEADRGASSEESQAAMTIGPVRNELESSNQLRKTTDPHAGNFLRRLANLASSKILISSRLYPADLQTATGAELPGCRVLVLAGLAADDALDLWRSFRVSGSRSVLEPLFESFDNYPLLIRALAAVVARFRPAPGNFDVWVESHPSFEPYSLPLIQRKSHVLQFALQGLSNKSKSVLYTLAGFRMPASYRTLCLLLVGSGLPLGSEDELDLVLSDVEDRGLVGWDRLQNRYDLHPVVRGVTWQSLGNVGRRLLHEKLRVHFEGMPLVSRHRADTLDVLAPAIELYCTLVSLGRYDEAFKVFDSHLYEPALVQQSECLRGVEWLEGLYPDGTHEPPRLNHGADQRKATGALAYAAYYAGDLRKADSLWDRVSEDHNRALTQFAMGRIENAESLARRAIENEYSAICLRDLGLVLGARGLYGEANAAFEESFRRFDHRKRKDEHRTFAYVAACWASLDASDLVRAELRAERALAEAQEINLPRPFIAARTAVAAVNARLSEPGAAMELARDALTLARSIHYSAGEVEAALVLAESYLLEQEWPMVQSCLDDLAEVVARGPYRLGKARMHLLGSELCEHEGRRESAILEAKSAYSAAWCDGPPFAYAAALERAKTLLGRFGACLPTLEPKNRGS